MDGTIDTLHGDSLTGWAVGNADDTHQVQDKQQDNKAKGKTKKQLLIGRSPRLEMASKPLDANDLGKLLTGGDTLPARHLNAEPFEFRPTFKLILQTNHLPAITDAMDKGIRRRLIIVPFTAQIEHRDTKLKQKLLQPENLNACLAWCVEGAKLLRKPCNCMGKSKRAGDRVTATPVFACGLSVLR